MLGEQVAFTQKGRETQESNLQPSNSEAAGSAGASGGALATASPNMLTHLGKVSSQVRAFLSPTDS